MSANLTASPPGFARAARPLLFAAMPLLGLANQYLAVRTARALTGEPLGAHWLVAAAATPWVQAWIPLEIVTFAAWMVVLSQLRLSEAFPMTAAGYLLVVGLGWVGFHEPVSALQILGGAAILAGVWLLSEREARP